MHRRSAVALTGALIAALLLATGPASVASRATLPGYVGSYVWTGDDPQFGGFSGIEVARDGSAFTALTDRGAVVTGHILRTGAGLISRVTARMPVVLALPAGAVSDEFRFDTEGLALTDDGSLFISTEYVTRVIRYDIPDAAPVTLPNPPEFDAMGLNAGLEALAIGADGTLYTLPEEANRPDGAYPVYRFRNGSWDQPFLIAGQGSFLPVGADIGPDGRLYLLERQFRGFGGFASRVRRMPLVETAVAQAETVLETPPGYFGNLEGIAVWRDTKGVLRLTMISDDNFLSVLGTEIVEFRLRD